jgi:NDP-hexose 4-ketoreductase
MIATSGRARGTVERVLLFGASGFIGRQVRRVMTVDARIGSVCCPGRERFDLVHGDLVGLVDLIREVAPDAVVNCTGRLSGSGYELVAANTSVTAKLVEALATAAPRARLVRLGSAAEYGPVQRGRPVAEEDPAVPVGEYGLSQLAATRLVEFATGAGRIDGVVLRVFNPIGPGTPEENLLGRAAVRLRHARAAGADHIQLGPLGAYRDFVDVRDVATAVLAAALAPRPLPARLFNVASGTAVTAREAVSVLATAAGFTGEIREGAAPPVRSVAVPWIRADIRRAARILGWHPIHPLADSVTSVLAPGEG